MAFPLFTVISAALYMELERRFGSFSFLNITGCWAILFKSLSLGLDRSTISLDVQRLSPMALHKDIPSKRWWGWRESISVWLGRDVQVAGPGAPPVSVITFLLLTVPTMHSIGCDILIK